jgi:sec-independent protein translocase protein TatA
MELLLVLAIAVMVLGPKKLPEAGRSLGRGIREFKDGITGETTTIDQSRADTER